MIKLNIIALGKLKEKYLSQAVDEYKKRLSRYCDFKITEIQPIRLSENPSRAEIEAALDKEAELIFKALPKSGKIISLCVEGKELSSPDFAGLIEKYTSLGENISFIIGSSYGLSDRVKQKSDFKLSLSQMTFPHQLFRVMLSEQLYRAFKINEGSTYHK